MTDPEEKRDAAEQMNEAADKEEEADTQAEEAAEEARRKALAPFFEARAAFAARAVLLGQWR